jgi:large subunit ribosomal protein L13
MKNDTKKEVIRIDAEGKILGRLATEIALVLQGKNNSDYTPNKEPNNVVIVSNVKKIKITGNKLEDKTYFSHSGYIGNDKYTPMSKIFEKNPEDILRYAVNGMLPKNRLRARHMKRLKFD